MLKPEPKLHNKGKGIKIPSCFSPLKYRKMSLFRNFIAKHSPEIRQSLFQSLRNTHTVMGVSKEQVESLLTDKLSPSHLEVVDTSGGCGASFVVSIVSDQFEGKRLLERHRLVNSVLAEQMKEIHALSITKALTPDQWKEQQETSKTQATA